MKPHVEPIAVKTTSSSIASAPAGRGASLWPAFFLIAGLLTVTLPQTNFLSAIPGDLGDARLNNLILEHVYRWILGEDASLWSPGFFYPFPGSLAFSDNHFGTVLIYALFRVCGLASDYAFIAWYVVSAPLNFLCCHYALRRFGLKAAGASAGAFVFTFALTATIQCGHEQLSYRFAIPLAMVCWRQWVEKGDARDLSLVFAWVTVQLYCSIYMGYFLLLLLGASAITLYLRSRKDGIHDLPHKRLLEAIRNPRERNIFSASMIVMACLVALAVLLLPYHRYSKLYGFQRSRVEIADMLPRAWSYFIMDLSGLWGSVSLKLPDVPMRQEHQMFFGFAAIILALIGCLRAQNRWSRNALVSLTLLVALTLNVHDHSLYALIERLPLAKAIRAVTRIGMVMLFPLGILAGNGYDWLTRLARRKSDVLKVAICALLTLSMMVEYAELSVERVPVNDWRAHMAQLKTQLPASLPKDTIVFFPIRSNATLYISELDGMSVAQVSGLNSLNGYSGNAPAGFYDSDATACEQAIERIVAYSDFAKRHKLPHPDVLNRIFVAGQGGGCAFPPTLPMRTHFSGPANAGWIGPATRQALNISPAASNLETAIIAEESDHASLRSASNTGQPTRLSRRFIDAFAPATAPDKEWDPRLDVPFDATAHSQTPGSIMVDAPSKPG
jgi:hypothetical protein